jgi:hypothetical protein
MKQENRKTGKGARSLLLFSCFPASLFSVSLLAGFCFVANVAQADLVVVQKVDGAGQSGEQTTRIKGSKARCDIGGAVSVIVDRQSGETTTLAHAQRGFLTLSPERSKAMLEKLQKVRGAQEPPKLEATPKKEKIGDYQCDIFTADLGATKVTYWLAKDYPNFPALLAQLDVIESSPAAANNGGVAPRTKDLPGMPMKIQMETSGQKVTVSLLSVKEENVDPKIFNVPKDYKELPTLPPVPAARP